MELENNPLIGPAPATASANDEVTRILSREVKDTYDLLGVKSDVGFGVVKNNYWRLSLMVHPDKRPLWH